MKTFAALKKELILLWRDKVGLVILFILPMCLVLFISLTTTDQTGAHAQKIKVLVLNRDKGEIGKGVETGLKKINLFKLTTLADKNDAVSTAKNAVRDGKYQVAIIVPTKASEQVQTYLQNQLRFPKQKQAVPEPLQLLLDPGMPIVLKDNIKMTLQILTTQIQTVALAQLVSQSLQQPLFKLPNNFFTVKTQYVSLDDQVKSPNTVQYNVPAWTLFGMFFIVIPLAGMMVRERELGLDQRLEIAPVWHLQLMLGRILAFLVLNQIQLWLMLAVGIFILPLFGLPTLEVMQHLGLIFVTGIFASLAATGAGLLIGTWASTYEQATVLGPFLIVIAAAIGGILAPIDLMPSFLQTISGFSPLNWAQSAFLDIFVRNANFAQILPNLLKLFGFFILMLILSLTKFIHPKNWWSKNND